VIGTSTHARMFGSRWTTDDDMEDADDDDAVAR
jgi:hypothetical protein